VPTVLVNCFVGGDTLAAILPYEEAGGRAATELLLAARHRRIAYLRGRAPGRTGAA
jgi:LacI family transcriptional regulator